jgi:hypothetical protein
LSGRIVTLECVRVARLADEIASQLEANSNSVTRLTASMNVDEWRRAARLAGRRLGIQVRTGVSRTGDKVWAVEGP